MSKTKYPRNLWVLSPSMKPLEKEFIGEYEGYEQIYFIASPNKTYRAEDTFATKAGAIAHGRALLIERRGKLQDQASKLDTCATNLDKAEAA